MACDFCEGLACPGCAVEDSFLLVPVEGEAEPWPIPEGKDPEDLMTSGERWSVGTVVA